MKKTCLLFILLLTTYSSVSATSVFIGSKTITLIGNGSDSLEIGSIQFNKENERTSYDIKFNGKMFSDEFLSMRPFKCIHKSGQMICHLLYPYKKQGYISEHDLVDLEYDLLFLHKALDEYGINPWNGMYYDLKLVKGGLEGILKEVDLNVLAAPPEEGNLRPITRDMLHDAETEHHLFPRLTIK